MFRIKRRLGGYVRNRRPLEVSGIRTRMRFGLAFGLLAALTAFVLPAGAAARPAAHASAAGGSGLLVTVAARECASYQDIRANLARNNIMESLQDLGEDTLYTSGEPINPQKELEGQPDCKPIAGWEFTLGSGILEKASKGPWGALSIVTGAEAPTVKTKVTTPLLGWEGEPIPGHSVRGAATFELNTAQAVRAGHNSLWIQGGTTTDPVLFEDPRFEGEYGFGALRCSIDNLNGDNVETIAFPSGTTHAFCYAYYVTPPPSSGKIVIRKEVKGAGASAQEFHFGGNVSYNPGGAFELSAAPGTPGSETFFRGETRPEEAPWTVHEEVPEGWVLSEIHCDAPGGSAVTTDRASASVDIDLAAGDTVTCTYVDTLRPPAGALLLRKVTENGTGTFHFRVLDSGGDVVKRTAITTTSEDTPAYADPLVLSPGEYTVEESSPGNRQGDWHLVEADCDGNRVRGGDEVHVTVADASGVVCTFTNRLAYHGRLAISKETIGGVGNAIFQITSAADQTLELHQSAEVKAERSPVLAHGDSTAGLPYGAYTIQEAAGEGTRAADWSLVEVVCDGKAVPFDQGRAVVHLSHHDRTAHCKFVNLFRAEPKPPEPGPGPGPEPAPGPEPGAAAEIAVSKTLLSTSGGAVPTSVYRIEVKNLSDVSASDVVVTDQPGPGLVIVSAEPSDDGYCVHSGQYACSFPSIDPHGEQTVLVKAKDYGGGGTYNRAIVGSASPDEEAANNVAAAHAKSPVRNYPACGSSVSVSARC